MRLSRLDPLYYGMLGMMLGEDAQAADWAERVTLSHEDFFRAFPIQSEATKARVAKSLARFGF